MGAGWAWVGLTLAVVVAGCSDGADPASTVASPSSTTAAPESTVPDTTGPESTVPDTTGPAEPVDLPAEVPIRYRVDTDKVAADSADPFLNVRWAPGASEELLAKLPPNYRGLRWLGEDTQTADGGLWYLVELLDPVAIRSLDPIEGPNPAGWVNADFILPLANGIRVGTDDVDACAGGGLGVVEPSAGDRPAGHIYALESELLAPRCLRTVISFGTGDAPVGWSHVSADLAIADSLPLATMVQSGVNGMRIWFDSIESVWPGATDTSDGVFIVRDHGQLQLVSPVPVENVRLTARPDEGTIVIDMALTSDFEPPSTDVGIVVLDGPTVSRGWVEISGIARPFEANLGLHIENADGAPVEAIYSGSLNFGTIRATDYAVQTEDWLSAWAGFAVRAEGLTPGDYTFVLDADGGGEVDRSLRVPFTFPPPEDGSEYEPPGLLTAAEHQLVQDVVAYARGWMPLASMPFAADVGIGVNSELVRTVPRSDLGTRSVWEVLFPAFDTPASGVDILADIGFATITKGTIDHCASPSFDPPSGFEDYQQLNVQPIGIDSCLRWFGIKIFVDDAGLVGAVTFEGWEP